MTQKDFERIENLKRKIENYERILELVKEGRGKFAYAIRSSFTFDYLTYNIEDGDINKQIVELINEKLKELKREFSDLTIM